MELETNMPISPLLPLPAPPNRQSVWKRLAGWLIYRGRVTARYDTPVWRAAIGGLWIMLGTLLVITSLGMPTGIGILFDAGVAVVAGTLVMAIVASVAGYVLSLVYVPLPRLTIGATAFVGYIAWYIGDKASLGDWISVVLAVAVAGGGLLGGLFIGVLAHRRVTTKAKVLLVIAVALVCASFAKWPINQYGDVPADAQLVSAEPAVEPIQADDPAKAGPYGVKSFTYGSGEDTKRAAFGSDIAVKSASVDASAYIHRWKWLRSLFWGFDETELPINGRVWMPDDASGGPYPLVLIVHGNHLMEQFSDDGYAYLGEMLASRGFIAVSVDENFLNFSFWGNIPDNDMKVRAWILLKHLQQIQSFNEQAGNPFYRQVDLKNVALIGHSRGGQAVAMAADRDKWFADDQSLQGIDGVDIQAVIGIAPTDNTVNDKQAQLKDIYYLSIQGASDGDVDTFNGERQYIRTSFSPGSDRFKSTLYIGEANHSRFNTSWGTMDDSLPGGLLLRRSEMMDADDQREVAKVYVSAFLESALHGDKSYERLFADYRAGQAWLPNATYLNRYEDGSFLALGRIDENADKSKLSNGVTAKADRLHWTESSAEDRDGNNKGTRGAVLQWKQGDGSYSLTLAPSIDLQRAAGSQSANADATAQELVFNMTNLEKDLPDYKAGEHGGTGVPLPEIEIELQSRNGAAVRMPLSAFKAVTPLPYTHFTLFPWMEDHVKNGKYKQPTEAVFQTYTLPFSAFAAANPAFDPARISKITFFFTSDRGKVMLDDIGIAGVVSDEARS